MSLFLDQKYISLISNRLPLFKRKNDFLYNCRCTICGDSTKNSRKARGYFVRYKNRMWYKCHNCGVSMSFGNFLKGLDSQLFSEYSLEEFKENNTTPKKVNPEKIKFDQPSFPSSDERLLDKLLDRLDTLDEDNEAVVFCKQRLIPRSQFSKLYYIDNIANIVQLNDKYKNSIKGNEPRLVVPFYNEENELAAVTCRALRGEALRYITVKIKEESTLLFGINEVNKNKTIYVVEGPLDSLFLDNSVAAAGTALGKIDTLGLPKEKIVLVLDNQPRNKEVCKLVERNIELGYKIVIWPQNIQEKDINDMVIAGHNVKKIISTNTFEGLTAKAKFIAWKRC